MFATKKGLIKKTEFPAYNTPIKADGIIAIKLRDDDELVAVRGTSGRRRHHHGLALRPRRPLQRVPGAADGPRHRRRARHERLPRDNACSRWTWSARDTELLVVTENGYGKRTPIADYPVKGRGTKGVKTIQLTERKGGLAGALIVREHQELVFISQSGMVQRTSVRGISKQGRPAQGVKVMNLRDDDTVSAVALVMESDADTSAEVQEDLPELETPPEVAEAPDAPEDDRADE